MFAKIKSWLFGKVILRKVLGKFIKHGVGVIAGLEVVQRFTGEAGITVDWSKFESWLIVIGGGLFGAAFNFIEHRAKN